MSMIGRGWRRFRALPTGAQAAAWVGLAAAYSVALILILGGGGGDDPASGDGARTLSSQERAIGAIVASSEVKEAREQNDVPAFRKPSVRDVRCDDEGKACEITYSIGLPGRGRIFEDQQRILKRLFEQTDLERVTLLVVRAPSVGKGVPAKANEETPPGTKLLATTCVRTEATQTADSGVPGTPSIPAECDIGSFGGAGAQARQAGERAPEDPGQPQGQGDAGILGGGP